MSEYIIETLVDAQPTVEEVSASGDIEVQVGNTFSEGTAVDITVVEVHAVTPEQDTKIESYVFSHAGNLSVMTGTTELPIVGGLFSFESVGARVATAPTGSSVVLDVKKNGSTIFPLPADRPTIVAGSKDAVVGSWGNVTVTTGDYLTVDIVAVGSGTPGASLVVPIRLHKIG